MSKIIELTTQLLPIISVGMYESELDPRYMFEDEISGLKEDNLEEISFDSLAYEKDVVKCANEVLADLDIENLGILSIKMPKIVSPNYYNYGTDIGDLDVEVIDGFDEFLRSTIDNLRQTEGWEKKTDKRLKNLYGSCDGFISWMPQSVKEIYKLEMNDYERCVSAFFRVIMDFPFPFEQEGYCDPRNVFQEQFIELCYCDLCYNQYAKLIPLYPEELFKMPEDEFEQLMADVYYGGIICPYKDATGSERRTLFLNWCKDNSYETEDELRWLLCDELCDMPQHQLDILMWDLYYAGVKYPHHNKDGEDGRTLFLRWCNENGYETESELRNLLLQDAV